MTPTLCHPGRSLAKSEARRRTESKDPVIKCAIASRERSFQRATPKFALVCVLALLASSASPQMARFFPGPKSGYASPDGHFVLQNVDREKQSLHSIQLLDEASGKTRNVYDYISQVAVTWAPDARHFGIGDLSRLHVAYIYRNEQTPRIDLRRELQQKANIDAANGDNQFDLARWLDPENVAVLSWRYAKERPQRVSCHCYVYALNGAVETCSQRSEAQDLEPLCPDLLKRP